MWRSCLPREINIAIISQGVYYANYLKYFEEGRTEYFSNKSIDLRNYIDKKVFFVVRNVNINYKYPARYQDIIEISTFVEKIKNSAVVFKQKILKEEKVLVEAEIILACVDENFKPIRMPEEIKTALSK